MCVRVIELSSVFYNFSIRYIYCLSFYYMFLRFRVRFISCKNNLYLEATTLWSVSWMKYCIQKMHICIDCSHGSNVNFRTFPLPPPHLLLVFIISLFMVTAGLFFAHDHSFLLTTEFLMILSWYLLALYITL